MRVLVVEDSPIDREILRHSFCQHPEIEAFFVDSLSKAKENIAGKDVVILDLVLSDSMPEETVDWIKESPVPVIVMSGCDDPNLIRRAATSGAINYLSKVSASSQLWSTIHFTLAEWERTQEDRRKRKDQIRDLISRLRLIRGENSEH